MDITYHYPPELFQLLVDGIPLLCRSKKAVIQFFRGAGIGSSILSPLDLTLATDRNSISKFEIVRRVLSAINEQGEQALRERREVLKRIVEFEDFSTCWPDDQYKAKGVVAEIRRVVNVKDTFTRINIERKQEAAARREAAEVKAEHVRNLRAQQRRLCDEIGALFAEPDPSRRGLRLEKAVNDLFAAHGILVRESFRRTAPELNGVLEQIDGVVELDAEIYLVEVKWLRGKVGTAEVSPHLVRLYSRDSCRGLFISVTEFSEAALEACREALQQRAVSLCLLEEITSLLDEHGDLQAFLKAKVRAAIIDKKPFVRLRRRASG